LSATTNLAQLDNSLPATTAIGLMSGTSVDSIDACVVRIQVTDHHVQTETLGTFTLDIPEDVRSRLLACMRNEPVSLLELTQLDRIVGDLFAEAALGCMRAAKTPSTAIDCIGSHGQTVFHAPPLNGEPGTTLQIGNAAVIAERCKVPVISDFRSRDMAVGGQGAPLVPFADWLLFSKPGTGRCVQNIGGIGNVTVLPVDSQKEPIAFDTGPGNMLMDLAAQHWFNEPFDRDGALAAKGTVIDALLTELMTTPYLGEKPPKSTGRELFGAPFFQKVVERYPDASPQDIIATLTCFTADTIVDAYRQYVLPLSPIHDVVLGGGGVYNPVLRSFLRQGLDTLPDKPKLLTSDDLGVHSKYKEAMAFALLAWASFHGIPGNIPSCTGASKPVVLGHLTPAE
jgi:anhydro-N-acetylmuramic acid kinase